MTPTPDEMARWREAARRSLRVITRTQNGESETYVERTSVEAFETMRTALPRLLDECERLRGERERYAWAIPSENITRPPGCRCDMWPRGHCRDGCPSSEVARLRAALVEACDIAATVDARPELRDDGMVERDHRGRAIMRQRLAALRALAGGG